MNSSQDINTHTTDDSALARQPRRPGTLRPTTRLQTDWIDVDGVRLSYGLRRGRGRPILILNALGANLDALGRLVNALDGIEVIAPDMPGAGHSPALALPRRPSWQARLLIKMLDRLGYHEPINVTGLAWGGSLAQELALTYPERVNRLVLASSSVVWPAAATRLRALKRLATAAARRYRRAEPRPLGPSAAYGGLVRRRPDLVARRSRYAESFGIRNTINHAVGAAGWTSLHRLHGLRCPTLIMTGDDDPIVSLFNARVLYWLIPTSYLHIVRGGGHLFLLVRANESAAVIKRFISERRYDGTDDAGARLAGAVVTPELPFSA